MDCVSLGKIRASTDINSCIISINYLWLIDPIIVDWVFEQELSEINNVTQVDLILSAFYEPDITLIESALLILKKFQFKSITFIAGVSYREYLSNLFKDTNVNLTFVEMWSVITTVHTVAPNTTWNSDRKNSLLLTGKLLAPHRLGLLVNLYNQHLLDNIMWSFPVQEEDQAEINTIISEQCFNYLNNNSISIHSHLIHLIDNSVHGLFNFTHLYADTNFSIVSDTVFDVSKIFVSEKVFRAIINKHPFILAAPPHSLSYLKSFGFRTFEEYLPNAYDHIENHEHRLETIITNIAEIQKIILKYKSDIQKDIDYNFDLLLKFSNSQLDIIRTTIGLDTIPVEEIGIEMSELIRKAANRQIKFDDLCLSQQAEYTERVYQKKLKLWLSHYNIIKTAMWPELATESDYYTLPPHIQEECIGKFNFGPFVK